MEGDSQRLLDRKLHEALSTSDHRDQDQEQSGESRGASMGRCEQQVSESAVLLGSPLSVSTTENMVSTHTRCRHWQAGATAAQCTGWLAVSPMDAVGGESGHAMIAV